MANSKTIQDDNEEKSADFGVVIGRMPQRARGALEALAANKHAEAYRIEKLLDALPAKLSSDADQALCELVAAAQQ